MASREGAYFHCQFLDDDEATHAEHSEVLNRWMSKQKRLRSGEREALGDREEGRTPPLAPNGYRLKEWVRFDEKPRTVFLTTLKDGPLWRDVVRRDTYDLWSNVLIASEDVADEDRDDQRRWHLRLPEPNPRATKTVLTYKELDDRTQDEGLRAPDPCAAWSAGGL